MSWDGDLRVWDLASGKELSVWEAHLARANDAVARGELVLGGALADPVDAAILLFRSSSPEAAERFAAGDPYVLNGLVKSWRVREWVTVVGPDAEVKV